MGYIPSNFKSDNNLKIVMSESVYARLAGCINFCGYDMGSKLREAGTVLYGHLFSDGIVSLEIASEFDDYDLSVKGFTLSQNMRDEIKQKTEEKGYNVICHVHTHPYFQGDMNRHYSQPDIDYYKREARSYENSLYLGCMLSVSGENKSSSDDISFMYINASTGEITNVEDIYVSVNGKPIPLPKQHDIYVDQRTNIQYPITRTLFEIDENMLTQHSSVRR